MHAHTHKIHTCASTCTQGTCIQHTIHICVNTHACIHTRHTQGTCIQTCKPIHIRYIHANTHSHKTHTCKHMYKTFMQAHIYANTCASTNTHVNKHVQTHTNTQLLPLSKDQILGEARAVKKSAPPEVDFSLAQGTLPSSQNGSRE